MNRSLAYLKIELFSHAHKDACEALTYENVDKEKAFYRKAKAEYLMRKFEESLISFEKCLSINTANKEALSYLNKCKKRLHEQRTGEYDFEYLAKHIDYKTDQGILRFDLADYCSDLISIRNLPKKGMSVLAVKDIKRGTLLMVSKAASIVYEKELGGHQFIITNMCTKRMDYQSGAQNFSSLIHVMQGNPDMAKEIYKLYSGEFTDIFFWQKKDVFDKNLFFVKRPRFCAR